MVWCVYDRDVGSQHPNRPNQSGLTYRALIFRQPNTVEVAEHA